jgi:hypothetical protein
MAQSHENKILIGFEEPGVVGHFPRATFWTWASVQQSIPPCIVLRKEEMFGASFVASTRLERLNDQSALS